MRKIIWQVRATIWQVSDFEGLSFASRGHCGGNCRVVVGLQPTCWGCSLHRATLVSRASPCVRLWSPYRALEGAQARPIQNSELTCGMGYAALSGLNVAAFADRGLRSRGSLHPRLLYVAPSGLLGLLRSQFRMKNAELAPTPCPLPENGEGDFCGCLRLPGHGRSGSLSPGLYIRARKRAQCRIAELHGERF